MQFLLGSLVTAVFFISLFGAYKLGQRSRKPIQKEIDEETLQKAERLRRSFEQMMSYDVSKAVGKKVN